MRLINTKTLQLEEFFNTPKAERPGFAILSHTWGTDEVSYQDMLSNTRAVKKKLGYQKIFKTCELAQKENRAYAWIDTCCIDKTSSSELSEAINSMFAWYKASDVCYVVLSDVSASSRPTWWLPEKHISAQEQEQFDRCDLARSRWFTRGWTLQELLVVPSSFVKRIYTNTMYSKLEKIFQLRAPS